MSSHHIVKEKQEPALYIHELADFEEEALGQLLEWSPTVIVRSSEYEKILSLGIKIDLVAGSHFELLQEHTELILSDGDELSSVLEYLAKKEYPAVNIVGAGWDLYPAYADRVDIAWFNGHNKTYRLKRGFSVWKPAGTIFEILSNAPVETVNLKTSGGGKLEVMTDGFVSFGFAGEYLMITEEL